MLVNNLWWKYEGSSEWTLKGIDIEVKEGEFLGIMGPTGAGKTTLCMCMQGLIPQRVPGMMKGFVKINEMDSRYVKLSNFAEEIGMIFQDPESQFIMMAVEDEIAIGLESRGMSKRTMRRRIRWAINTVGLDNNFLPKTPAELSGGQKQRVAIASVLALQPRILVLDEPTSDLDPIGKEEIFTLVGKLKKKKSTTIIMVEHESEYLAEYADRIIVLNNGRIEIEGKPKQVFSQIDKLKNIGIRPPQITELLYELKKEDLPLTVNEASNYLRKEIMKDTFKINPKIESVRLPKYKTKKPIIVMKDLHHIYPDGTEALKGINLNIHEGEYVAIIGPNGSGKTTLTKHFDGILKPTSGTVTVKGKDVKESRISELAGEVGYCFQNPDHQLFCQTVEDEVKFAPKALEISEREIKKRANHALKLVGLEKLRNEHPFFLGKGQRQRLAFASVMTLEPNIFIVDEPTTGQDDKMSKEIMSLLDDLNDKGHTIIVITHNMRLVCEHVSRVIVMLDGKVIADGSVSEIFEREKILNKAQLQKPQIMRLAQTLSDFDLPQNVLSIEEMLMSLGKR